MTPADKERHVSDVPKPVASPGPDARVFVSRLGHQTWLDRREIVAVEEGVDPAACRRERRARQRAARVGGPERPRQWGAVPPTEADKERLQGIVAGLCPPGDRRVVVVTYRSGVRFELLAPVEELVAWWRG